MSEGLEIDDFDPILEAIETAEEIADPLDGLEKKTVEDPGAAFTPEALERLLALKSEDRAAFEALRARLKKAGCRVTALDAAMAKETKEDGRGPKQADILIDLAGAAELFHSADGVAYADVMVNDHRETWTIRTKGFRRWLARQYFEGNRRRSKLRGPAVGAERYRGEGSFRRSRAAGILPRRRVRRVSLSRPWGRSLAGGRDRRNGMAGNRKAAGTVSTRLRIETYTRADAGRISRCITFVSECPDRQRFRAGGCMGARCPARSWSLSSDRAGRGARISQVHLSRQSFGPLLDPNSAPLRALPREDRDLFIAARNGHVLAFDNVSGLPTWISDTLCRLATGGGFAVRQLFTDQDEVLFDAARPVILNGIEDIVTRPDLADRALFLTLEPIPEDARRLEAELWAAFEAERPRILGALLDAVAEGLKRLPDTHLPRLPRMADFATWATACEPALWPAGTFWSAYCGNRDEAVEGVIDADPVAAAVRAVMTERTVWTGTATDLLGALAETTSDRIAKSKTWPDSPRALSGRLRRAATFLRKAGIEVAFRT